MGSYVWVQKVQESIKFIVPGFVSCFGETGVPCVGNGFHFRKTILMNISNITFEVARFSTCSESLQLSITSPLCQCIMLSGKAFLYPAKPGYSHRNSVVEYCYSMQA